MAEYRIRTSGEIVTDLRRAFPNSSIPEVLSAEDYEALGIDMVFRTTLPPATRFQRVEKNGVFQDDGIWYWQYIVVDFTAEEIATVTEQQWVRTRDRRNKLLALCDWTQLADVPLTTEEKAAWATHRQALRDVTTQVDPFEIIWPVAP